MRTKFSLLIICLCLAVGARAQVQIRQGTQHVMCDVTMKDGTTYKGYEIELPHAWDKKIKIKKGEEKLTLKSDDVDFFKAWHEKAPEAIYLFKYTGYYEASKKEGEPWVKVEKKMWMVQHTAGPFMEYWFSCAKFKISKNFKLTGYGSPEINNFLWIKGSSEPNYVPWPERVSGKFYRGALKNIVKDDPALVKEIEEEGGDKKYRNEGLRDLVVKYMPTSGGCSTF